MTDKCPICDDGNLELRRDSHVPYVECNKCGALGGDGIIISKPDPMADTDVLTAHDLSRHIKYIWHSDEQSVGEIKKRDNAIEARAVAAKDKEIEILKAQIDYLEGVILENAKIAEKLVVIAEKNTEIARLRQALKFYANEDTWVWQTRYPVSGEYIAISGSDIDHDKGDKAREALKSSGETL